MARESTMTELDEPRIAAALFEALARLAPVGGERRLDFHVAGDALVGVLAQIVAASPGGDGEVERLCRLFRQKVNSGIFRSRNMA